MRSHVLLPQEQEHPVEMMTAYLMGPHFFKKLLKIRAVLFTSLVLLLFGIHDVIFSNLDRKVLDIRRRF